MLSPVEFERQQEMQPEGVHETRGYSGYSQRAGDGLNVLSRKLSASFEVLTNAEAENIIGFFNERAGYLPFMWTLPGEVTARQWIAPSCKRTFAGTNVVDVTAKLEETFDL